MSDNSDNSIECKKKLFLKNILSFIYNTSYNTSH